MASLTQFSDGPSLLHNTVHIKSIRDILKLVHDVNVQETLLLSE